MADVNCSTKGPNKGNLREKCAAINTENQPLQQFMQLGIFDVKVVFPASLHICISGHKIRLNAIDLAHGSKVEQ